MKTPNPKGYPRGTFPDAPELLRRPNHWSWDVWAEVRAKADARRLRIGLRAIARLNLTRAKLSALDAI